jgi:hypothetical protein
MQKSNKPMSIPLTTLQEAHGYVRALAEPWRPGDSVKAAMGRVARRVPLTPRRIYTLWYRQPCALLAHEMDALRAAYRQRLDERAEQLEAELRDIEARAAELEQRG